MPRKKDKANAELLKGLMTEQEDFLRKLVEEVVHQVLEAEMDEALGAQKGEHTAN